MANPSAAKLHRKSKKSPRTQSPPRSTSDSNTAEDERKLPSRFEALIIKALNTPLSTGAALSASSTPSTRKATFTPYFKSINPDKPMPPSRPAHLLIISLGNPPPYHNTRHSAGHILLQVLTSQLNAAPLQRSRDYGGLVANTTTEGGTNWTLFQSPSLMNVSGPAVLKAFKMFSAQYPRGEDHQTGLVILHDELELDTGEIKVKKGEGSAKGHNGIKSVQQSLQSAGLMSTLGARFLKVGLGIGRPLSRDRDEVSEYVLGRLSGSEKGKIEGAAEALVGVLEKEAERMGK